MNSIKQHFEEAHNILSQFLSNENNFEAIEKALKNTSGKTLVSDLYGGTSVSKYTCLNCGNVKERTEDFQDISKFFFLVHT